MGICASDKMQAAVTDNSRVEGREEEATQCAELETTTTAQAEGEEFDKARMAGASNPEDVQQGENTKNEVWRFYGFSGKVFRA
jgi:hypothetical protein